MKFGLNTIIPLKNGKIVTVKWYTNDYFSNVLKRVENITPMTQIIHHSP